VSDLPSRLLYREHYVAAVRPKHPLAKSRTIARGLCSYDHVLVSPTEGSFEGSTDEELTRMRKERVVRYSVPSFLLVPALLQIDDLIALVPSRLLRGHGTRLVPLRAPINVPASMWLLFGIHASIRMWRIAGCVCAYHKPLEDDQGLLYARIVALRKRSCRRHGRAAACHGPRGWIQLGKLKPFDRSTV
jgi:hypothetical protein